MPAISFDPYSPGFLLAFAAGLVNTLSPCCLAMTPAFLSHVTGAAVDPSGTVSRRSLLTHTALYMAGFSFVFILIGVSITFMGYLLIDMRPLLWKVGGVVVIAMGFHQAGIIRMPMLMRTTTLSPSVGASVGYGRSVVVGATYSLGWTACIGPVLGSILTLAAVSGDFWLASYLLIGYSLGMAVPHFAYALTLDRMQGLVNWLQRRWTAVEFVSGGVMIVMGVLIFSGALFKIFTYFQFFNVVL